MKVERQVEIAAEPARISAFLGDPIAVARCMPGASIRAARPDGAYDATMSVRVGPVTAEFAGEVRLESGSDGLSGVVVASGADPRGRSGATAEIRYVVSSDGSGTSAVAIDAAIELTGPLAQFERTEFMRIVQDRLFGEFAQRLQAELGGQSPPEKASASALRLVGAGLAGTVTAIHRRLLMALLRSHRHD